jgi:hypothetical protein
VVLVGVLSPETFVLCGVLLKRILIDLDCFRALYDYLTSDSKTTVFELEALNSLPKRIWPPIRSLGLTV